ncbi:MAG TPA: (Fe-S)-binding protein [Nevskiaceae bacterium]|nr:(Fe-S)-binding protein [Nevskiaceae bacterium]
MSALPSTGEKFATSFPLEQADQCVKCGLCLPHCPTYLQTQHEGDSPRGRIALMQGLAMNLVPLSEPLERHLDGCLSCRACERVCPAKVPYGHLIDQGRQMLAQRKPERTRTTRAIGFALTSRTLRNAGGALLWLYQRSGLQWLVRTLHLLGRGPLARMESLLPRVSFPRFPSAAIAAAKPAVQLFTGCAGELFDGHTLRDASQLLSRLGWSVEIPRAQACCGAIHQHGGETHEAARFVARNLAAFDGDAPVLCSASGCGATLLDYPDIVDGPAAKKFRARVRDIDAFLLEHWPASAQLKPLAQRIAVHTPCTLKNVMKSDAAVTQLLKKIPQADVFELDAAQHCCGAAGSYFITQPEMADRLLQRKLDALAAQQPDLLVSTNIGCTLHIAGGLRRRGLTVPVVHPVTLLAHQLA